LNGSNKNKVIKIHPVDNVLVALADLLQDEVIAYKNVSYKLVQPIPAKHKFFVQDLKQGDEIKMYGVTVGKLTTLAVKTGEQMTVHKVKHAAEPYNYKNLYGYRPIFQ
jgi:altronate hydrolase